MAFTGIEFAKQVYNVNALSVHSYEDKKTYNTFL